MKTNIFITVGKVVSILILILGIIHIVATFTPLIQAGLSCLAAEDLNAVVYMSLICGGACVLSGLLIFMMLKRAKAFVEAHIFILIISIFLMITGVLAIIYMVENPFAWLAFSLNWTMFGISLILMKSKKVKTFYEWRRKETE